MKQKIIPVASIIIGIIAFLLTGHHLRNKYAEIEAEKARVYAGARRIAVVVAAEDIPGRTVVRREDLGRMEIFESTAPDRVITPADANLILGRKTLFEIKARKPILWSDIEGGAPGDRGLADAVKPGMRAISISVSGAASVSGMVQPNDRIDVLGTFMFPARNAPEELETVTLTVLQDVTVLAVGNRMAREALTGRSRSSGYSTVTLEVTPREAELLVFAQQVKGRLVLSLRNPNDVTFERDLPEINFEQLETSLPDLNEYRQRNIRHKRD